jgi:hypothetical protein
LPFSCQDQPFSWAAAPPRPAPEKPEFQADGLAGLAEAPSKEFFPPWEMIRETAHFL